MRLFLILLLAGSLAAAAIDVDAFDHEAYVWQRRWTPELAAATASAGDVFRGYRVLVGEVSSRQTVPVSVDWPALAAARVPVTLVLRIDGASPDLDAATMVALLDAARTDATRAGVTLAGIEIDHDCARARLPAYAALLRDLRARVDTDLPWSITALPDWMNSDALPALLAEVDTSVLQVHAVAKPGDGLFDPAQALRWIRAYDRVSPGPFRVALPAYATRVTQSADGRLLAIESEAADRPVFDAQARELVVDPRRVAVVLRRLREAPPRQCAGIAWFRLPLPSDRRAWSMATVRALVADEDLARQVDAERVRVGNSANFDLWLRNRQRIDAMASGTIALPRHCTEGEGVAGYRFDATRILLVSDAPPLLKPGVSRRIGWIHCPETRSP